MGEGVIEAVTESVEVAEGVVVAPGAVPARVDVAEAPGVPVVWGAELAVWVSPAVADGAGVRVKVGSGVFEGGSVNVGIAIRVNTACVRAEATRVACASPAEICCKPEHALNATARTSRMKANRRLITTSFTAAR